MATNTITLTKTEKGDLIAFFLLQLNKEANYLAAFTAKDPTDKNAYIEKHTKFLSDPTKHTRTIKVNEEIVGSSAKFFIEDDAEIPVRKSFYATKTETAELNQ